MEELKIQIEELSKRIEAIEKAQNLDMNALLFEGLLSEKGSYGVDLQRTISGSIPSGGGSYSFIVPENPTATVKVSYKGQKYRLLLYSLS